MSGQELFAIFGALAAMVGLILRQGALIRAEIRDFRAELRAEIDKKNEALRTELGEKIEGLRTEFSEKFEALHKENEDIREQIGALTHRMRLLENAMIEIKATLETYLRVRVAPPLGRPDQPRTGTDG